MNDGSSTATTPLPDDGDMRAHWRWFEALAWAEGASLLVLVFVTMPLKYAAHVPEPTAYVGWLHGALFLLYLVALAGVRRLGTPSGPLSIGAGAVGVVASGVPFGTFAYLWWLSRARR